MAVAPLRSLLEVARARGAAVGAFTCYDLVTGAAVLSAAERNDLGVILLASAAAARAPWGRALLRGLRELAGHAAAPCCVELDHCDDLGLMEMALDAGVTAVMADGSRLPDAQNAALVARAAELAAPYGAAVEAELGHVAGNEEVAGDMRAVGALTDPAAAQWFVAETGADCLAVSIGNVHGRYRTPPQLDLARLRDIRDRVDVPLALHGASGLGDELVGRAVALGICKVNVNQELRERWFDAVGALSGELRAGTELLALQRRLGEDLEAVVAEKLDAWRPVRRVAVDSINEEEQDG